MPTTVVDTDTNKGVYHIYNVGVRITQKFPILQFFNDHAAVPEVIRDDHATNVWVKSEGRRVTDWPDMQSEVKRVWEDLEEPVYFFYPLPNPAHCLHDCMFSIALEAFGDGPGEHNGDKDATKPLPHFQKFLYASLTNTGSAATRWDVFLHEKAGILQPVGELFRGIDKAAATLCFKHLVVPRFMRHRFAHDWRSVCDVSRFSYIETAPTFYPQYNLRRLQERLFATCFNEPVVAWPDQTPSRRVYAKLLLHDRGEAKRRKWSNGAEAFAWIQRHYDAHFASMVYLSNDYVTLSPMQQARLFHSADVVIAPHGGALANLIFCRPGTRIIELTDEPGPLGWFSFTRRLKMFHFPYQPSGLETHYPTTFGINMACFNAVLQHTLFADP